MCYKLSGLFKVVQLTMERWYCEVSLKAEFEVICCPLYWCKERDIICSWIRISELCHGKHHPYISSNIWDVGPCPARVMHETKGYNKEFWSSDRVIGVRWLLKCQVDMSAWHKLSMWESGKTIPVSEWAERCDLARWYWEDTGNTCLWNMSEQRVVLIDVKIMYLQHNKLL